MGISEGLDTEKHTQVLFTPLGQLRAGGKYYKVPYKLDINGLVNQLQPIELALKKVRILFDHMNNSREYLKSRRSQKTESNQIPDTLMNHLAYMILDVKEEHSRLNALLFLPSNL